jgi:phosphohistidine phosphatase
MDLILWRHAYARRLPQGPIPTAQEDLARELTAKGHAQARVTAKWLRQHLSASTRVLCSPALRCQETARYLEMDHRICESIDPQADAQALLEAARWPGSRQPVLLIGHQHTLGQVLSRLMGCGSESMPFKKAGIWWLRHRVRDGVEQTTVHAVVCPESLHG